MIVFIMNNFAFHYFRETKQKNVMMEEYLRQRIDCPPVGGTRILIEEKDRIIKKQQDELKKLQLQIKTIQNERDHLLILLSNGNQM